MGGGRRGLRLRAFSPSNLRLRHFGIASLSIELSCALLDGDGCRAVVLTESEHSCQTGESLLRLRIIPHANDANQRT
jgi:hypothetical protein